MSTRPKRYHLNVVGDFFVEEGCCTMCHVPQHFAPELFQDDGVQCYVSKQPFTTAELELMYAVIEAQDLGCIQYSGRDAHVLAKLRTIDGGRYIMTRKGLWEALKARFFG